MPSNNSKYSEEMRVKTVKFILESGRSANSVGEELGIVKHTHYRKDEKDLKIRDLEKELKRKDKLLDEDIQGVESERTRLLSVAQTGKAKKRANHVRNRACQSSGYYLP